MNRRRTTDKRADGSRDRTDRVTTPLGPAQRQSLENFWVRHGEGLIAQATRNLVRLHIGGAEYSAEEAADDAILGLCGPANRRKLAAAEDDEALLKLSLTILRRVISDARRRSGAGKRSGAGAHGPIRDDALHDSAESAAERSPHRFKRRSIALDDICSPGPAFDSELIEEDRFQVLLEHLGDPVLRTIACMRQQGFTRGEIADELHLPETTVAHKLAIIRSVFLGLNDDEETAPN